MAQLLSLSHEQLQQWLAENAQPRYRLSQIFDWIYKRGIVDFEQMTNLSLPLRQQLLQAFSSSQLRLHRIQESTDQETTKFLWQLADNKLVESVLIRSGSRRTVCVSSQIGCRARCAFCASGKQGFFRNLTADEIVSQVIQVHRYLVEKNEAVTHVVFMGMGEPLENIDALLVAIETLTDPNRFALSRRRITVSTVGIIDGIKDVIQAMPKVNLVFSLHAPNQKLRQKLIPYARKYSLDQLLPLFDQYSQVSGRDVTYEYILIAGINDQPEHAEELAALLKGRQCTVNLIPYNPVPGLRLERPTGTAVARFRQVLENKRVVNTCRYTKGDDIAAACGQLALQEL